MKPYVIGFILGASTATGGAVIAAVGDFIYEANDAVILTGPQAADIADCYIAKGAWTGSRSDMRVCTIARVGTSFPASCSGTKTASGATLPIPVGGSVSVVGRVQ
jgi:hypothetical protein